MAIPVALSIASALAPSVIRLIGSARKPKPTRYEQELSRLSSLFRQQAEGNYFASPEYRAFLGQINRSDERVRARLDRRGITGGLTDEARLAGQQGANEVYGEQLNSLAGRATAYKSQGQQGLLATLGAQQNAEAQRLARFDANLNAIGSGLGSTLGGLAQLYTPTQATSGLTQGMSTRSAKMPGQLSSSIPSILKLTYP
jgi:murein L,D-transpeptidase YcbB/YkuD